MKSLRRTGIFTVLAISCKYFLSPLKKSGSVNTEMAAAPATSYSLAISKYGKCSAIIPFEGDAFFTSQMKLKSCWRRAASKGNPVSDGNAKAAAFTASGVFTSFSWATRTLVASTILSKINGYTSCVAFTNCSIVARALPESIMFFASSIPSANVMPSFAR